MELRPYQEQVIRDIHEAWSKGATNVLVQLATGGGKTVIFSNIIANYSGLSIAIAHRVELVSQISLTLARYGVRHNLLVPKNAVKDIVALHMAEVGKSYYDPHGRRYVAGVDTLIRMPLDTPWFSQVGLVVQDEGHHPLKTNKWGKAAAMFPAAKGLYPTATPCRADGNGLGRHADGIMDALVLGVTMRELINNGYLTEYRIFAPPNDLDLSEVPISAGGDYSPVPLKGAVKKSKITGDVVKHYLRIAPGMLGVTFAVSIEAATEIAIEFKANGVPAEVISSQTPDLYRAAIMRKFRNREILQLVNVDLLGEGVDVPAIQVVSFARPSMSYALYSQQFGRALRPMAGKPHAIIIDHVGNVIRHGLPDAPRKWSLDRRERKRSTAADDAIPLRTCLNTECLAVYSRAIRTCPHCGHYSAPVARATPEQVDGDLTELDAETLATLRGEIARIDEPPRISPHQDPIVQMSIAKKHRIRQEAQHELRAAIAQWAGYLREAGDDDSKIYRNFYFAFGVDIATAQTLGTRAAEDLTYLIGTVIDNFRTLI